MQHKSLADAYQVRKPHTEQYKDHTLQMCSSLADDQHDSSHARCHCRGLRNGCFSDCYLPKAVTFVQILHLQQHFTMEGVMVGVGSVERGTGGGGGVD